MIEFANKLNINIDNISLKGVFEEDSNLVSPLLIKEKFYITKLFDTRESFIYLGKKDEYTVEDLNETITSIVARNLFGYNVYIETFTTSNVSRLDVTKAFTYTGIYKSHTLWNKKTEKSAIKPSASVVLIGPADVEEVYRKCKIEADNTNLVRDIQTTPHNWLNSEQYPEVITSMFQGVQNVEIQVLGKAEIEAEKMGLFLSVNAASAYEPRVIVIKYRGNAGSKNHLVMVGKGIMYDAGGINVKIMRNMNGMKYDKSGSAIVAGAIKTIADLSYQTNVTAVLMCTDNMISNKGSKPDDVYIASNGMSVEVNNTDAEGRLVMADGLVYGARKLHASHLLDVATLTGAVRIAFGKTYTAGWATDDQLWRAIETSAKEAHESVWRLPFHEDYLEYMKKSATADLRNTDFTGNGGSISAAMFLKEFTDGLPYMHFDIASTAKIEEETTGVLVKTLANLANLIGK